nr:MAG TPA: hypothetical protein [Caudoviricetes sp.]
MKKVSCFLLNFENFFKLFMLRKIFKIVKQLNVQKGVLYD